MECFDRTYYDRVLKDNWYESLRDEIKPIDFSLNDLSSDELSLSWFCHHNAEKFADIVANTREKVKVITWIGLSWIPHLGTLSQMMKAIKLQQKWWLPVKFVLWDLDAYNWKWTPLNKTEHLAKVVKEFMLELWFDESWSNELESQYSELEILRTMYLTSNFMDDTEFDQAEEDLHGLYLKYWKVDKHMTFRRKMSLALMVAWWYHQQLENDEKNLLITLGIDEHKYVRFGQRILERMQSEWPFTEQFNNSSISAVYSTLIWWFNGFPKMSKSFPTSWITVDMTKSQIHDIIMSEQRINYRLPEDDVVFQCMSTASTFDIHEIEEALIAYREWWKKWEEIKRAYVENLWWIVNKWPRNIKI